MILSIPNRLPRNMQMRISQQRTDLLVQQVISTGKQLLKYLGDKNVTQEQSKRNLLLQRSSSCQNAKFMADGEEQLGLFFSQDWVGRIIIIIIFQFLTSQGAPQSQRRGKNIKSQKCSIIKRTPIIKILMRPVGTWQPTQLK